MATRRNTPEHFVAHDQEVDQEVFQEAALSGGFHHRLNMEARFSIILDPHRAGRAGGLTGRLVFLVFRLLSVSKMCRTIRMCSIMLLSYLMIHFMKPEGTDGEKYSL